MRSGKNLQCCHLVGGSKTSASEGQAEPKTCLFTRWQNQTFRYCVIPYKSVLDRSGLSIDNRMTSQRNMDLEPSVYPFIKLWHTRWSVLDRSLRTTVTTDQNMEEQPVSTASSFMHPQEPKAVLQCVLASKFRGLGRHSVTLSWCSVVKNVEKIQEYGLGRW